MKVEDIKIGDVVKFKSKLLNKKVEDIGVVVKIIEDEAAYQYEDGVDNDGWIISVVPFNLKMSEMLLCPKHIKRKIGEYSNYDLTNDETNHKHKIGYEFTLKLSDEFFDRYINEIGYPYWKMPADMKRDFNGLDKIECRIEFFERQHMYKIYTKLKGFRLSDKFIDEFSI